MPVSVFPVNKELSLPKFSFTFFLRPTRSVGSWVGGGFDCVRSDLCTPSNLATTPMVGAPTESHEKLYTAYLLVQWIALSSVLILLNKHILSTAGFNFPVTLVLMHMSFCSLCALIWKLVGWITVPHLGGPAIYCARFVPVGLFFAASLCLGNSAYLFISVAFVQMLKASTPVATLLVSLCLGLERPSCRLGLYIMLVSCGIIASCVAQVVRVGPCPCPCLCVPCWECGND